MKFARIKRCMAIILSAVLVLSLIPGSAFAEGSHSVSFLFTANDAEAELGAFATEREATAALSTVEDGTEYTAYIAPKHAYAGYYPDADSIIVEMGENTLEKGSGYTFDEATGLLTISTCTEDVKISATTGDKRFSGGSGTSDSSYEIADQRDLRALSRGAGISSATGGLDAYGLYFAQTADIDLQSRAWEPIGTVSSTTGFRGVYDGRGYTISGLVSTTGGLFHSLGNAGGAYLRNIHLIDPSIDSTTAATGGLVGYGGYSYSGGSPQGPHIQNCSVQGGTVKGIGNVGGLVGTIPSAYYGNIDSCFSSADVIGSAANVGGLIGNVTSASQVRAVNITNCYATGSVTSSGGGVTGGLIGMLAGKNSPVTQSFASGNVSSTATTSGGLFGVISNGDSAEMFNGNIAMNTAVTGSANVGRIYGRVTTAKAGFSENSRYCYAFIDMLLNNARTVEVGAETANGISAFTENLKTKSFWSDKGYNFSDDTAKWIWQGNDTDGYPILNIKGGDGNVISQSVLIPEELTDRAVFIEQPQNIEIYSGDTPSAPFSVRADGNTATLAYQWQRTQTPDSTESWGVIADAISASYTVPVQDATIDAGWYYRCVITDKNTQNGVASEAVTVLGKLGGGTGTEHDPFTVSSQRDLEILAADTKTTEQAARFDGKFVEQTADIILTGYSDANPWPGIGTVHAEFKGTYDGNGYTISGLNGGALFARLLNADIRNLYVKDAENACIVAYAEDTDIQNCGITMTCLPTVADNTSNVTSGIVKSYQVASGTHIIENCYADVKIAILIGASSTTGGIASNVYPYGGDAIIRNCYVTGYLASGRSGEIVGYVSRFDAGTNVLCTGTCLIENCFSAADINVSDPFEFGSTKSRFVISYESGGLIGSLSERNSTPIAILRNNAALGNVNTSVDTGMIPEVVGRIYAPLSAVVDAENSYNNYALNTSTVAGYAVEGNSAVNGIDVTKEALQTQSFWADTLNFDFTSIWEWDETTKSPALRNLPYGMHKDPYISQNPEPVPFTFRHLSAQDPTAVTVTRGSDIALRATVSGTALTYQWQRSSGTANSGYQDIQGATGNVYTVTNADTTDDRHYYRCVASTTDMINPTTSRSVNCAAIRLNVVDALSPLQMAENIAAKYTDLSFRTQAISLRSYVDSLSEMPKTGEIDLNKEIYAHYSNSVNAYGSTTLQISSGGAGRAVLDYIAAGLHPRDMDSILTADSAIETIDMIEHMLSGQGSNGQLGDMKVPYHQTAGHLLHMLALEAYFDGAPQWGNEYVDGRGRNAAIDFIFSDLIHTDKYAGVSVYLSDGMVTEYAIPHDTSLLIMLFSRLSNDPVYGERAYYTMLEALKYIDTHVGVNIYTDNTPTVARIISAYVAANSAIKAKEGENERTAANDAAIAKLLTRLQLFETSAGSGLYSWYKGGSADGDATAYAFMALGDVIHNRAILATIKHETGHLDLPHSNRVARDMDWLGLVAQTRVDLHLPTVGAYGSNISWTSSRPDVIAVDGTVTRQPENVTVTLTASISSGNVSAPKRFDVLVPADRDADGDAVFDDLAALTLPSTAQKNLALPTMGANGSAITWTSSNIAAISHTGTVTRSASGSAAVETTLTATATKGDASGMRNFVVTVLPEMDAIEEGYNLVREHYLTTKRLTGTYWDMFAAYSVLYDIWEDYATEENGYTFFDPRGHTYTQTTDYAASIMAVIIAGENPYNYKDTGLNLVEGLIANKTGPFACNVWGAMAFDALLDPNGSADSSIYIDQFISSVSGNIADIGGWMLVALAKYAGDENHPKYQEIQAALEWCYNALHNTSTSWGNPYTAGCIFSGFSAIYATTGDERFNLANHEYWALERYGNRTPPEINLPRLDFESNSTYEKQLLMEFGDLYFQDSVWRRLAINREKFDSLISRAEGIISADGASLTSYTAKSGQRLTTALAAAKDPGNAERFGLEYFELQAAIKGLKAAGEASVKVYGDAEHENILSVDNLQIGEGLTVAQALAAAAESAQVAVEINGSTIESIAGLEAGDGQAWFAYIGELRVTGAAKLNEGDELTIKFCSDVGALKATDTLTTHLVQDARNVLVVNNGETVISVGVSAIALPTEGLFGTTIGWLSNKAAHLATDGKITRLQYDNNVTLTAIVALGSTELRREFNVTVKGTGSDSGMPPVQYAVISVTDPFPTSGGGKFFESNRIAIEPGETAYTLLLKTGLTVRIAAGSKYPGVYVESINGLAEFDEGEGSGWMYSVNGRFPQYSSSLYVLNANDEVKWLYTRNLGTDIGGGEAIGGDPFNPGSNANDVDETVTNESPPLAAFRGGDIVATETVAAETKTENGKATATVTADAVTDAITKANEAIAAAKENGAAHAQAEIKIAAKVNDTTEPINSSEVNIPAEAIKAIAAAQDLILTIESDISTVTLDTATLTAIAETAKDGETIKIAAETGEDSVIDLTISVGTTVLTNLGGAVTVSIPYTPEATTAPEDYDLITVYHLADDGTTTEMKGAHYDAATGKITFATNHFSKFFISEWINPFTDIAKGEWFYKSARYAYSNALITGTTDTTFAPQSTLTRAMLITILARDAGIDTSGGDTWYSKAVDWGMSNGLTDGTNMNNPITREQFATLLFRYAKLQGKNTSKASDYSAYTDAESVSDWAREAMAWAYATGLVTGRTATTLAPLGTANRAEAATLLQRYLENVT